jgi:hypothetical protein
LAVTPAYNADGGFVVHSFAGDDPIVCKDHVRQKLGLPSFQPGNSQSRPSRTVVKTYDYTDDAGEVLFQVIRYEPKGFSQRRPDLLGGWINNLDGVRRVPYKLPELIESVANERPVFVVEGEKAVDALREINIPATCNPHGAGKWRDEYSEHFKGATVYILPDNDETGRDHAKQVEQSLKRIAATVRIINLPGLPYKGDAFDWVAAGGAAEQLNELVETSADAPAEINLDHLPPVGVNKYGTFYIEAEVENLIADAVRGQKPDTDLPELIINPHNPPATARELASLIAKGTEFLFNGNTPVRVTSEDDEMPRAIEVTNEAVRDLAHKLCVPIKAQTTQHGVLRTRVPLSRDIASLYLNGLEGEWRLKIFRGITTAPILGDDGSIRTAQGYDRGSSLWCHNIPAVTVPANPSQQEAEQALSFLRSTFRTFPFADGQRTLDANLGVDVMRGNPGADESSFLVGLMTAVCRQSLELSPGFLCNAPSGSGAGTGKGLLVRSMCLVSSGAKPSAFVSGHDSEEFDKRLTAAFIEARPAVFLDNFNAKELKSDILASVLTENPAMVRIMGQTKNVPLHTRTFVAITGNGVQIAEDMVRRLVLCNLNANMADPEQRKFEPGFDSHIYTMRPQLLSACLTIWRWGRLNRLVEGIPLGSYEVWSRWCRDPLLALGCSDPISRLAEIKAADPVRKQLIDVFDVWWEKHGDVSLKATELAPDVLELIDEKATKRGDGTLQFNRQAVARWLMRHVGTWVGPYHLEQNMEAWKTRPIARYRLVRKD